MDLNHLNLRVRDPAACRDFYERHFGFRLAFEAEGGYFMRNERGFLLALTPSLQHQPLAEGVHIGFGLDDPESVDSVYRTLSGADVRTRQLEDFRLSSYFRGSFHAFRRGS